MTKSSAPGHSAIPVSPSLEGPVTQANIAKRSQPLDRRILWISFLAILLGIASALVAHLLVKLIGLVTNAAFYGQVSSDFVSPAANQLGLWVILVPVTGGLIVGAMAKWGSKAIRGHGIPEAMEQVLRNESRILPRMTWLKPVSSAIVIGTGGPFGAEGPIIATGGALGSLLGQVIHVTANERKALLAAGAAAGMAAIFAAPISALLLAIELLLFERRARTLIPVALAVVTATSVRFALEGSEAVFAMSALAVPGMAAVIACTLLGALLGAVSVGVTRITYGIEDAFEKLPIHWAFWPAIGGLAIGIIGYFEPATLGVGYDNISAILNGTLALNTLVVLCVMKFLSWSVALGSGTSGGTLAPLFMIGGAIGGITGIELAGAFPELGLDPRLAALVGMAALFAGASRAFLTSVVFAFETTQQPHGLLPLLAGCAAAYLVSGLMMRQSIMTEKIARRGVRVPSDYASDYLDHIRAGSICSRNVQVLDASQRVDEVIKWIEGGSPDSQHQGFPLRQENHIVGVITRKGLMQAAGKGAVTLGDTLTRPLISVQEDHSAREAADCLVDADIGRLVVFASDDPQRLVGILTRGDLLAAHSQRLKEERQRTRHLLNRARTSP
ncbi:chloride channel protein [Erwinia sp. E_sp_B01_1]|uniref:chloride channel protein n=4 Tax=Erwinia TaxID=551 RepID=UPI0030CEBFDF